MAAWKWAGVCLAVSLLAARVEAGSVRNFDTQPVPRDSAFPFGIVVTPDGRVWFSQSQQDRIGRYTLDVGFEEFATPSTSLTAPGFMTRGADGNVWFTEQCGQGAWARKPRG